MTGRIKHKRRGHAAFEQGCAQNKTPAKQAGVKYSTDSTPSLVFRRLENLTSAIHTCFQVNVVRAAKFTRILVFDKRVAFEAVMRTAHSAA
jgi:uncharacterized OsmC-like protein